MFQQRRRPVLDRKFFVSELSLLPFLILEINKSAFGVESLYHKDSTTSSPLNKVKPCLFIYLLFIYYNFSKDT